MFKNTLTEEELKRERKIILLSEPPLAVCPSQVHRESYTQMLKHAAVCPHLRAQGVQRLYQCQFMVVHLFATAEQRRQHEINCPLYTKMRDYWDHPSQKQKLKRFDRQEAEIILAKSEKLNAKSDQLKDEA